MDAWTDPASGAYALIGLGLLAFMFAHFVVFERRSTLAAGVVTAIVTVGFVISAVLAIGGRLQLPAFLVSYGSFGTAWWYAKRERTRLF